MCACTSVRWGRIGCVHALAGSCCGLGLNSKTLSHASPCPSASTACGFGAQAFYSSLAFNANIGAWNTAAVTLLASVCAASRPGGAHCGARARRGIEVARPVVRGGTADARMRAHMWLQSLALGPWV